jgi:MFS family permease
LTGDAVRAESRRVHRDPNAWRWVCAYTASIAGDSTYFIALSWAAVVAGGPSAAGFVTAVGALPRLLLMLVGGVIADRFGPRRVIIGSDTLRCGLILSAATWLWFAPPGMWLLLPLAATFGVVDTLFMPAVGALPPRLTSADQLGRLQAMRALAVRSGNLAGPSVAGVALATDRVALAFGASALLFLVSLLLLLAVRTTPLPADNKPPDRPALRDLRDGLRYVRRHTTLGPLLAAIALSEMCFSGTVSLAVILLVETRDWGASAVGWLLGAFSIGGAVGALLVTVRPHLNRAGLVCAALFALVAAAIGALPATASIAVATALVGLAGLAGGIAGVIAHSLVQIHSDVAYLGRVTAVLTPRHGRHRSPSLPPHRSCRERLGTCPRLPRLRCYHSLRRRDRSDQQSCQVLRDLVGRQL